MTENRPYPDDQSSFGNANEEVLSVSEQHHAEHQGLSWGKMDKTQKTLLGTLGVLALGIIVLFFVQLGNIVEIPWPADLTGDNPDQELTQNFTIAEPDDVQVLKNKDTDGDGISDYDELQVYKTSPYLDDSDSDGYPDRDEIIRGEDPNCPAGVNCFSGVEIEETDELPEVSGVGQTPVPQPSPAQLRQLLEQSGQFTAEQLAEITDDDLLNLYNQLLDENPELKQEALQTPTTLQTYSPDQIRELLRQQGITEDELAQFSDDQLMDMYQDALNQVSAQQQ